MRAFGPRPSRSCSVRNRAALTKLAHQWSCGWALYCSHSFNEGPPTTIIHSPLGTLSPALAPWARIDSDAMRRKRFIEFEGKQYSSIYAGNENLQLSRSLRLVPNQILPGLPFSDQCELTAPHQRFRGQRARIIIRRHHESVRACTHDREQITFVNFGHLAVERKKIARFTNRPHNVDLLHSTLTCRFATSSP